ncbi:uncharacterized protein LOC122133636 [Clupea harengus]|uniref:Uncharacterized protein LOC122133636 n=1 Tax=Clupea harengus TaxID=7950 RepID=A0A8M1KQ31_CLUHA|nr:uncharacterized protein LOC122133636 [Clupea harengus]
MPVPKKDSWRAIADGFLQEWNFPNCVGSIDGKHVVVQAPSSSGSLYFNSKHTFSIVLLAVVEANYIFRMVDVGGYGRNSDGGTLSNSPFGQALRDGTLDLPDDRAIPGAENRGPMPFVFVADEAYPLRCDLMRPFPGTNLATGRRAFNYRLSPARLIVECGFELLSSQWRMYRRIISVKAAKAEDCVKATCILQNYMRMTRPRRTTIEPDTSGRVEGSAGLVDAHPRQREIPCLF